jgi:hypothetical protein
MGSPFRPRFKPPVPKQTPAPPPSPPKSPAPAPPKPSAQTSSAKDPATSKKAISTQTFEEIAKAPPHHASLTMSILFSETEAWLASNWISRGFFEDCLPHLSQAPLLAKEIQFCVEAEVDTLDLRDKGLSEIKELQMLVERVIRDNEGSRGQNFHSPEYFPVYLSKLKELEAQLKAAAG